MSNISPIKRQYKKKVKEDAVVGNVPSSAVGGKSFKTNNGKTYTGPQISKDFASERPPTKVPVYLSPVDGSLYDAFYVPLSITATVSAETEGSLIVTEFPNPNDHETFFDYEQAVREWKIDLELRLGKIQLPFVVGRHFYRPATSAAKHHNLGNETEESYTDEDYNSDMKPRPSEDHSASSDKQASVSDSPRSISSDDVSINRNWLADSDQKDEEIQQEMVAVTPVLPNSPSSGILDQDPWDTKLYPAEPQPKQYSTYEDYEDAMTRWAFECTSACTSIPPHPRQLETILDMLTSSREFNSSGTGLNSLASTVGVSSQQENSTTRLIARSGMILVHTRESPLKENLDLGLHKKLPLVSAYTSPKVEKLLEEMSKLDVPVALVELISQKVTDRLYLRRLENLDHFKCFSRPVLARLHGILPNKYAQKATKSSVSPFTWRVNKVDLSESFARLRIDCPLEVNGTKVEIDYADPDLQLDFTKLQSPSYIAECRSKVQNTFFSKRYHNLNSWYFPNVSMEVLQKQKEAVISIVQAAQSQFSIETLRQVIWSNMYLDSFQDLLIESGDERTRTFNQLFLSTITVESFPKLLACLKDTNSLEIQAKLAAIIAESLQSSKAKDILDNLLAKQDLRSLYLTAHAMTFFFEKATEVFPYVSTTQDLVNKLLGSECQSIIKLFLITYYLDLISKPIFAQSFIYVAIYQHLKNILQRLQNDLLKLLKANLSFFGSLFKGLSHKSSSVSSFFLFMSVQLLGYEPLKELLKSPEVDFLGLVRKISFSKFSHVQFAVRRLFQILTEEPWWSDHTYETYCSTEQLCQDLNQTCSSGRASPSLFALQLLEACTKVLRRCTIEAPQGARFLLKEKLFRKLFSSIQKGIKDILPSTELMSYLFEEVCRAFARLKLIRANDSIKMAKKGRAETVGTTGSLPPLHVSPADLIDIINLIHNITATDERSFAIRSHVLAALRYLLTNKETFDFLKKETQFYLKIIQYCREGRHREFNRNAWRLFFNMIHYHSGVVDELIKNKLLAQFFDSLSTSSGNVVLTNGFHYLAKLPSIEQRRQQLGKSAVREDTKSAEKDLKSLVSFFIQRHQFIKVHMIYKRFVSVERERHPNIPGSISAYAFQQFAQFYNVIATEPGCSKIYKDILKNPEYKEGLLKISSMFVG